MDRHSSLPLSGAVPDVQWEHVKATQTSMSLFDRLEAWILAPSTPAAQDPHPPFSKRTSVTARSRCARVLRFLAPALRAAVGPRTLPPILLRAHPLIHAFNALFSAACLTAGVR